MSVMLKVTPDKTTSVNRKRGKLNKNILLHPNTPISSPLEGFCIIIY